MSRRDLAGRIAGFTLIELLVAMAIVAIIGAMAFGGINLVLDQREMARERTERWREIQLAVRIIVQDLSQIHPRPAREEFGGDMMPSIMANEQNTFALEFSRGGWANPAGLRRGSVVRVAYDWEDGTLVRYHWPVLDRTTAVIPTRTELLTDVDEIELRFLDSGDNWHQQWPPLISDTPDPVMRPRAIEFLLELEDYGRITRIVETIG